MISKLKRFSLISMTILLAVAWASPAAAQGSFAPIAQSASPPATTVPINFNTPMPEVDLSGNTNLSVRYDAPKLYTGERISLDFQNADIHNIIRIIGEVSGKNIVVSDKVTGKVTLKLRDVPWDQALDIVLASRNLGVEESGNVLTVYDLPTLRGIQDGRARMAAEEEARRAQAPLTKKVFTPKYAPIGTVVTELGKLKSERGKIVSIGNDIYVEDDPSSIATMSQVFLRVDRVVRQILIEARIIEATATFANSLGINWGIGYNGDTTVTGGCSPSEAGSGCGILDISSAGASLGLGFLNKANSLLLNAKITASETSSDARTISAPRIMAANDQEVSIKQGKQIPYQSGSSANTAANTQFKDVVMELKVTPHIEENGQIVTLDINLTNDTPDQSGGASSEPAINKREAQTKLMVKDGETVVIGGIITDTQTEGVSRVPGLHRIPLLGWLFQQRSVSNDKSEMLIFITANIIPINI